MASAWRAACSTLPSTTERAGFVNSVNRFCLAYKANGTSATITELMSGS